MATIEVKHEYAHSLETVFGSFTDKNQFEKFFFRTETGVLVESSLSPEVGGGFSIVEKRGDQVVPHDGTFLEFETNDKISFVFGIMGGEQTNYIEMSFNSRPSGSELVIKTEVEQPDMVEKSRVGWIKQLNGLDLFLSKGSGSSAALFAKDSQGNTIDNDDVVRVIKDLNVKGSSLVVKRGTVVKRVRLIPGNNEEVDCKVEGVGLRLETRWLLKS